MSELDPKSYANWMGGSMMVSLVHPDTLKAVMARGTAKSWNYRFMNIFLGDKSMLVDHGEVWHRARRVLTPMFYKDMMRGYLSAYTTSSNTLIDKLRASDGGTIDCHDTFALLTLDLTLQAGAPPDRPAGVALRWPTAATGFGYHGDFQTGDSTIPKYFAFMNSRMWRCHPLRYTPPRRSRRPLAQADQEPASLERPHLQVRGW